MEFLECDLHHDRPEIRSTTVKSSQSYSLSNIPTPPHHRNLLHIRYVLRRKTILILRHLFQIHVNHGIVVHGIAHRGSQLVPLRDCDGGRDGIEPVVAFYALSYVRLVRAVEFEQMLFGRVERGVRRRE